MRIIDTSNKAKLTLLEAIKAELAIPEDKLIDTLNDNQELTINQAIEQSVLKFFHPINNFEFKYDQSCYIFGSNLLLVNYVLNPNDMHHKIGLRAAFNRSVLDRENGVYYSRKGPVSLVLAIEKGYLSCEIVDLNLLNNIITSSIFKHSTFTRPAKDANLDEMVAVTQLGLPNLNEQTEQFSNNGNYLYFEFFSCSFNEPAKKTIRIFSFDRRLIFILGQFYTLRYF